MSLTGAALEQRLGEIEAFYGNELNVFTVRVRDFLKLLPSGSVRQAASQLVEASQGTLNKGWLNSQPADLTDLAGRALFKGVRQGGAQDSLAATTFQRSLVSMHASERACLRLAETLKALGRLTSDDFMRIVVPITWNKGDTLIQVGGSHGKKFRGQSAAIEILKSLISASFGENVAGKEKLQAALRAAMDEQTGLPPPERAVLERYLFAGARWLAPSDLQEPVAKPDYALRLGRLSGTETDLLYDLRESLITIAPPGAGKSQAHVLRNLLYLKSPAVVLDVKGEMRDGSAQWRRANVGPVHVFDPKQPATSLTYNPLDLIGTDPDGAWDQARNLADLLVVPPEISRSDSYFESRARDMITTAILDVALNETGASRSMGSVLDRIYLSAGEEFDEWLRRLDEQDVSQLRRQATALKGMPDKQREGVFDSARRQLEIWQSTTIEKLSRESTFSAKDLRETNGTLYLCVSLDDIRKFASVLRVIIGQTVSTLLSVKPEADVPPVTFFLDELPKLGRMDVIESALDAGRGYAVRLWMFCQNIGQLTTVYPNGEGMVSNCAARCFMNPDEETAQRISRNLGERDGLLDGQRTALAQPPQLSGPEFADKIIVFMRGRPPARVDKQPAFNDPICRMRIAGMPEPTAAAPPAPASAPAESESQPAVAIEPVPTVNLDSQLLAAVAAALPESRRKPAATPLTERFSNLLPPRWRPWLVPAALTIALLIGGGALALKYNTVIARETAAQPAIQDAERQTAAAAKARKQANEEQQRTTAFLRDLNERGKRLDAKSAELDARQRSVEARESALNASRAAISPPALSPVPAQPAAPLTQPLPPTLQNLDVEACDRLAANPTDGNRRAGVAGTSYPALRQNVAAAVEVCARALAAAPTDNRLRYQYARALQAAGRQDQALPYLQQLANQMYPAAFNNLAQLYMQRGQTDIGIGLLRRGAENGDADSMVDLAGLIESGQTPARFPQEPMQLLQRAAELGHQGAAREMANRQTQKQVIDMFGNIVRTIGR